MNYMKQKQIQTESVPSFQSWMNNNVQISPITTKEWNKNALIIINIYALTVHFQYEQKNTLWSIVESSWNLFRARFKSLFFACFNTCFYLSFTLLDSILISRILKFIRNDFFHIWIQRSVSFIPREHKSTINIHNIYQYMKGREREQETLLKVKNWTRTIRKSVPFLLNC